jgi:hypothetical protein
MPIRAVLQQGPKGKKAVAFAVDWPGWSRGAKTPELALELLTEYRDRYRPVAAAAGLAGELDAAGRLKVVGEEVGPGSTDFWGISFAPSALETEPMDDAELDRKIALLQACWAYFDEVAARVSPELRRGPRGGGRMRDEIVSHVLRVESLDFAKRLGLRVPEEEAVFTPMKLAAYRTSYVEKMRAYNAGEGTRMRSWNLAFLIRHSAFHTMDHAWEMQDKDLTAQPGETRAN